MLSDISVIFGIAEGLWRMALSSIGDSLSSDCLVPLSSVKDFPSVNVKSSREESSFRSEMTEVQQHDRINISKELHDFYTFCTTQQDVHLPALVVALLERIDILMYRNHEPSSLIYLTVFIKFIYSHYHLHGSIERDSSDNILNDKSHKNQLEYLNMNFRCISLFLSKEFIIWSAGIYFQHLKISVSGAQALVYQDISFVAMGLIYQLATELDYYTTFPDHFVTNSTDYRNTVIKESKPVDFIKWSKINLSSQLAVELTALFLKERKKNTAGVSVAGEDIERHVDVFSKPDFSAKEIEGKSGNTQIDSAIKSLKKSDYRDEDVGCYDDVDKLLNAANEMGYNDVGTNSKAKDKENSKAEGHNENKHQNLFIHLARIARKVYSEIF